MRHLSLAIAAIFAATPALSQDSAMISAAKGTLEMAQKPSFEKGVEHCGLLGQIAGARYIASKPRPGRKNSCAPRNFSGEVEVIASYHTHGSYDDGADAEVPSVGDVEADMAEGIFGFIATPGGRMWMINPNTGIAQMLCGEGCLPQDPNYQDFGDDEIKTRYSLEQLRLRERGG